ncbi:hypothetical protein [Gilliamella sp. G0441]|uniref:hypothetical protein n=2 Tax=Gilliamella TaxID=1193503 RepID=UPI003D33271F
MMFKIISRFIGLFLFCYFAIIANTEAKNNANDSINKDTTEWQLVNINYLSNSTTDFELIDQMYRSLKKISVKSNKYQLIFEDKYLINIKQTKANLAASIQNLLDKELKRLNLIDNQQDNQNFMIETLPNQYNLNESLVLNSDYLFLFNNNDIILTYKNKQKMRKELESIYNQLHTVTLPLNDRYWPPEKNDGFLPIPDEFNYFFKGMLDDDYLKAIKLKEFNNIKLLLLSSYSLSGSPQLSLVSLSNNFYFIDRMELGENLELEDGGIWNKFLIDNNYQITIQKIESPYDGYKKQTILLNRTNYIIDEKGVFVKLKR